MDYVGFPFAFASLVIFFNQLQRTAFLFFGFLFLFLGTVGIFVPLLPTTPFLILSAACFSRSSRKIYGWLMSHAVFGPILSNWENSGVIEFKVKVVSTLLMISLVSFSLFKVNRGILFQAIVLIVVVSVLGFIWTRPGKVK